jgi:hypothetical protein
MSDIKVGSTLVCISPSHDLKVGEKYTVDMVSEPSIKFSPVVMVEGSPNTHFLINFEVYENTTKEEFNKFLESLTSTIRVEHESDKNEEFKVIADVTGLPDALHRHLLDGVSVDTEEEAKMVAENVGMILMFVMTYCNKHKTEDSTI